MSIFGTASSIFTPGVSQSTPLPISMTMKVTKQQIGSYLKLKFFINSIIGKDCELRSEIFDLGDLATATFYFKTNSLLLTSSILIHKHTLAKDSLLNVKLTCKEPNCIKEWTCADDENLRVIGVLRSDSSCGNVNLFLLELTIYVSQIEPLFAKLYDDCEFTDFKLITDEGSVVVHKACLAVHSTVFKSMFNREWKDATSGQIKAKGVNLQALRHLKEYMYLGTLPDDGLRPLLLLATCYLMENLKTQCIMKLAQMATAETLFGLFQFALENKLPELISAILITMPDGVVQGSQQIMNMEADLAGTQTNGIFGSALEYLHPESDRPTQKRRRGHTSGSVV